jgi:hypothetical protein
MPEHRKAIGSVIWHSHLHCTTWPKNNYITSKGPRDGEICSECTALHALHVVTCPVIVNDILCGLELLQNSEGLFCCPVGHYTRLVETDSR